MKLPQLLLFAALTFALLAFAFFAFSSRHQGETASPILSSASWQHMAAPGQLSQPHAFLENNCAACHTPVKGVEAKNCIVCHADNTAVLQRQPSAFHADIGECAACHREHQGRVASTTKMDHAALGHIGCKQLESRSSPPPDMEKVKRWLANWGVESQPIKMLETVAYSSFIYYRYRFTISLVPLSFWHGFPTYPQRNLVAQTHGDAGDCPS